NFYFSANLLQTYSGTDRGTSLRPVDSSRPDGVRGPTRTATGRPASEWAPGDRIDCSTENKKIKQQRFLRLVRHFLCKYKMLCLKKEKRLPKSARFRCFLIIQRWGIFIKIIFRLSIETQRIN